MKAKHLVNTWYKISLGEDIGNSDVFFKFISLWVCFNGIYNSITNRSDSERDQIECFSEINEVSNIHHLLLEQNIEYKEAVNYLKERGVKDLRSGIRRKIRSQSNFWEVMQCIYQVRCNLFHGGKTPEDPRDETLIKASYSVLSSVVELFIRKGLLDRYSH